MMVSGSSAGLSSILSAAVKSDKPVMLVDGDGGAEDFGLLSGEISEQARGRWVDVTQSPYNARSISHGHINGFLSDGRLEAGLH